MKKLIVILFLLLACVSMLYAQCDMKAGIFGNHPTDNYIEVRLTGSQEGEFYTCKIELLRPDFWYHGRTRPTISNSVLLENAKSKYPNALDLYFDVNPDHIDKTTLSVTFDQSYSGDALGVGSIGWDFTMPEWAIDVTTTFGLEDQRTSTGDFYLKLTRADLSNTAQTIISLKDPGKYYPYATIKWKLPASASGQVGLMGRNCGAQYDSYPTELYGKPVKAWHPGAATNSFTQEMGFCYSGSGLIDIGGAPISPEITNLVADASGKACSGKEQTFVATVKNEYDDITWVLKTTAGAPASDAGTIRSDVKGTVTVTWADAAKGDYQLCGTPKKTGAPDGAEYCKTFTVFETPKVTLAYDNSQMCSGVTVTLKPQLAYGAGAPTDATTADLTKYNWTGGASPGTALTYDAVLADIKKTYNFSAETPAAKGSCPVSATVDLTGKSAPVIAAVTKEFPLLGTIMPDNTYLIGDMIKLSVPSNPNYKYEWIINGNKVGTDYFYIIGSATDAIYSGSVLVTDNTSGCSATASFTLTKNSNCGVTASITDKNGTTPVKICTNGIALLKVKATLTCSNAGNTVTGYAWYKKDGSVWVKQDSIVAPGTTENIFVAKSAGNYQARVYTSRGMNKAEIEVRSSDKTIALDNVVKTVTPLQVKRGNPAVLAASSVDVTSYLWSPETMFNNGGNVGPYPETKAINNNTKFYVYGTHYDNCISMASTDVEVSDNALTVKIVVSGSPVCNYGKARMTAIVSDGPENGDYEYAWTADSYSFGLPTNQQEAVINIADNVSSDFSLTRVVVVKEKRSGSTGIASAQVLVKAVKGPTFQFEGVASGLVCQKQTVTVKETNEPSTPIASYDWYIKKDGIITTKMNGGFSQEFNQRGDYTVWIAAKANAGCYSDTVNTKTSFAVKGFDLAWSKSPADNYKSGQTLEAEVQASGSSGYKFSWLTPVGGTASGLATANPNAYKLEGARENSYTFKVNVTDVNKCSRDSAVTVNKLNSEVDPGLMLALTSKEVNYCNGGTAIMSANATGGSGPYDFTWYTVGNENLPLQGPVTVTASGGKPAFNQYVSTTTFTVDTKIVVKVTDDSSPKLIRRDTVTVKKMNLQAPQISAGDDRKIAYGSKTYLLGAVIAGTPTSWVWENAATIQSGSTTQYPMTKPLIQETTFTAYAVDANKCTSALDDVKIGVTNDPSYKLTVDIKEPGLLCNGSVVTLDAEVTPGDRTIAKWAWNATLGSFNNKTIENPELTMTTITNTTTDLLVMVEDANGVTAVDKVAVTVQNSKAPDLKLEGYKNHADAGNYICSEETELKVSSTNGVQLSTCSWYVDGVEVKNSDNTPYKGLTYKHKVENTIYQTISATALSNVSCPSANKAEVSLQSFPRPVLAWASSSSLDLVQPGDAVSVTADLTKKTTPNYTYKWTHTGASVNPPTYTDGGVVPGSATSATSTPTLNGGASEATHPYYFQVSVSDKYGCQSVEIKKTISVNGDALYVAVSSKHGDYCAGGSAVLKADVVPADAAGLTYVWYKGATVITGETGKELLVANPDDVSEYHVEVTAGDGKSGSSAPFKLTLNNVNTAPVLTGVDQMIPSGTKTALIVTTPANINAWQWQPEDKLATGESKLRSPYTVALNAQQYYTVYGVDNNGCVGSAKILVTTVAKTPPAGADPELMVKVIPSPDTICVGNSLDLSTKVWTIAGHTPTYEWLPNDGNLSAYNTENPVFNPTQAALPVGIYSYIVKVTEDIFVAAARVDIHVVNGLIPELEPVDISGPYCAGSDFVVKVRNNVGIKKYTWIVNNKLETAVTGNTYTWPAVQQDTRYSVKVTAESNEHCRTTAALEINKMISPALKLNPLQVKDSCGQVIIVADAGNNANYTWDLVTGDTYLAKSNGKTNDTLYLKQKSPGFTTPSVAYSVKVTVAPAGGGCQSVDTLASKVYFRPKVKLALWKPAGESTGLPYVVTEKGTIASVSVDALNSNFTNLNSKMSWSARASVEGSNSAAKINNIQKDDTIRITVANKEVATCMATDSMPIYLYPEAPKVDIDTNTCLTDIAIKWPSLSADSVKVWGIVEDAYNVNGGGYKLLASVKTSALKWIEPNMNERLKFYYLQSVKRIGGRSFVSKVASDTVGWLKQTVYGKNPSPSSGITSSNNLIAYPFDMSAKGIRTDRDLYHKLLDKKIAYEVGKMGMWNFNKQIWDIDNYVKIMASKVWKGTEQNLMPGYAYWLVVTSTVPSTEILMYGKLMRFTYNFNKNPDEEMSSGTYILYPLSMMNSKKRQPLGMSIPVNTLGGFNPGMQIYENAIYVKIMSWVWKPTEAADVLLLDGWSPVRIVVKDEVLNWTK